MATDDTEARIAQALARSKLEVTTRDTDALSGKIGTVDTKLNFVLGVLVLILGLLITTNAATAFFTWRLIELVAR